MKKWENNKGSFDQAQENLIDAYAVYEAAAKAFDLNDRFLWPENPLSAFSGDDAWFMHDFTYHYFSKYIGKDNTIRKFRFKDYFKVYVQALNYKNMIDHILDDEELVPDFDLSFEDEFSELIRKENEEINDEKSEDMEQLHKQITDLTENRNEWKKEAQLLHEERNELRKDLEKINQRNEETEEENDLLKQENIALQKISYRYDELMAEKTKADPEEIHSLLSSRKIGISGMNKTMGLRFKEKYPDIVWYETAGDVNSGAGLLDYIFIMTQYNSHKITTLINKQVGSSKTRIINIGEVKSNFELAQKVIYAKIKEEEK